MKNLMVGIVSLMLTVGALSACGCDNGAEIMPNETVTPTHTAAPTKDANGSDIVGHSDGTNASNGSGSSSPLTSQENPGETKPAQ